MEYAYRNQDPAWRKAHPGHPETRLFERVSGAIERGEAKAIVAIEPLIDCVTCGRMVDRDWATTCEEYAHVLYR